MKIMDQKYNHIVYKKNNDDKVNLRRAWIIVGWGSLVLGGVGGRLIAGRSAIGKVPVPVDTIIPMSRSRVDSVVADKQ